MSIKDEIALNLRQTAGQKVEDELIAFMIRYPPCGHLTRDDASIIARQAKTFAFDAFDASYKLKE